MKRLYRLLPHGRLRTALTKEPGVYVPVTEQITDEMVERARIAQGRVTLGGKYRDSQDPEDIDTALFFSVPEDEMRAALAAAFNEERPTVSDTRERTS